MSGRALIFVESNTSGTGRLFVKAARAMGFEPVLITARPHVYGFLSEGGAPEIITVPEVDEDSVHRVLQDRFAGGREIAGITSSSEYFIASAAALAARFGLPGPDAASVRSARDKSWQRQVLAAAGFPSPSFRVVSSAYEAQRAARAIGTPVVVKPLCMSGSVGVRACANVREAACHAATLLSRDQPRVLIESLIAGPEFSVEVFSGQVIGITRKHLGAPPHFVEIGHDYPAPVPDDVARALTDTVTRGTALLGLGWGPLHWELRIREGQAYTMEVNPRLAGGFIPELVRLGQGIDLIRETLRLVVGERPSLAPERHQCASIRFITPPRAGRFGAADGVGDARAMEGVADVALYRRFGDALSADGDFRDRIGHVIACGSRAELAASLAARARDTIRIRLADLAREKEPVPCHS